MSRIVLQTNLVSDLCSLRTIREIDISLTLMNVSKDKNREVVKLVVTLKNDTVTCHKSSKDVY